MQDERNKRQKARYPGVYYKILKDGRRSYQVCWKLDGRLYWKAVPGGEKDAVRARAEIVSRLGQGQKVVKTRETFGEFSERWLDAQEDRLGERTIDEYRRIVRLHLNPALGKRRLSTLDEDDVVRLIERMRRDGFSAHRSRGVLVVLGRIMGNAARRGLIAENPVRKLERDERPQLRKREQRILDRDEIARLLAHAPSGYRAILATALLTGARQQEVLALQWRDIDFDAGVVRVRAQLSRKTGERKSLKTPSAERDVVLTGTLAKVLREHRLASRHSQEADFVFATATGKAVSWSNVIRRGLHVACERAELREPRPRFHDLRHGFASLLISEGADVVFVSRQLGHASPTITLQVYAHLFEGARHADRFRELLDEALGEAFSGNPRVTGDGRTRKSGKLAELKIPANGHSR